MEGQELTTITGGQVGVFDPETQLEMAVRAAKALAKVIAQKKKPVIINGEQYLEFEDWLTLGQFDGVAVRTGDAEPVEINGVQGAKAKAYLYDKHTGAQIGGAEAYCMRDEEKWGTRPKYEWQGEGNNRKRIKVGEETVPWFQLASMAQTRAGSKALRNKEAWIAVLAGYRPTPAEEMTENTASEKVQERRTVDKSEHYCPVHDVNFFKKGRMKNYAHPIEGTDEWCNEPEAKKPEPEQQPEASPNEPQQVLHPSETQPSTIDLDWLRESLNALSWTDCVKWLNEHFKANGKKVSEIVKQLTPDQQKEFAAEVESRLQLM